MKQHEALFEGFFKRQIEKPAVKELFDTFLKGYNPEKKRFKDRGWEELFREEVGKNSEILRYEIKQHKMDESLAGLFWRAIKKSMPLEMQLSRTADVLRMLTSKLTTSGGYAVAPRDIEFHKFLIRKDDKVRWEGRDFGGQFRVEFRSDRREPMGALLYDSRREFEDEWNVRTADNQLSRQLPDGTRWGEYLAVMDEQKQAAVPLRNIARTEKYLGHSLSRGTEDGKWGCEFVEEETRRLGRYLFDSEVVSEMDQMKRYGNTAIRRVIEAFNLESEAHGVYMSYAMSPDGKAFYRKVLKKYPNYNTDRKEAQKATDDIMKNLAFRVRGPAENRDKMLARVRDKVLDGIL